MEKKAPRMIDAAQLQDLTPTHPKNIGFLFLPQQTIFILKKTDFNDRRTIGNNRALIYGRDLISNER